MVHDIRQMDIHKAEPLVSEPSLVEVETAIGKLKRYELPGTNHIPAEFIKARSEIGYYVLKYTNVFVLCGIRRNFQSSRINLLL
jgi:hypothetical protein